MESMAFPPRGRTRTHVPLGDITAEMSTDVGAVQRSSQRVPLGDITDQVIADSVEGQYPRQRMPLADITDLVTPAILQARPRIPLADITAFEVDITPSPPSDPSPDADDFDRDILMKGMLELDPTYFFENVRHLYRPATPRWPRGHEMQQEQGMRAYKAGERLNEMLGYVDPEVCRMPPVIPKRFRAAVKAGFKEIGTEWAGRESAEVEAESHDSVNVGEEEGGRATTRTAGSVSVGACTDGLRRATLDSPPRFTWKHGGVERSDEELAEIDGFFNSLFTRPPPAADTSISTMRPNLEPTPSKAQNMSSRKRERVDTDDMHPDAPNPQQKKARKYTNTLMPLTTPTATPRKAFAPPFPGHTPNLLPTLLTWFNAMSAMYAQVQHPSTTVPHNPVFLYPPTAPIDVPLLGIACYDTSTTPAREILFVGPEEVLHLSYAEVDTYPCDARTYEGVRYVDMRGRNEKGWGRWCFVSMRFCAEGEWACLAWPGTVGTGVTGCGSTVYPDMGEGMVMMGLGEALRKAGGEDVPPVAAGSGFKKSARNIWRDTLLFEKGGGGAAC